MRTNKDLDPDQVEAVDRLYEHDGTFLVGGMGSGKTAISEYAIADLLHDDVLNRVLVIAPLKVCPTAWANEHLKWAELAGLRVCILAGVNKVRRQHELSNVAQYDIVVANFELLPWLKAHDAFNLFDGLLVDESTKLKSHGAYFKALRHDLKHFKWRTVMTGTPVSENWQQLFYQMFLVDLGKTLGTNRDKFERKYFYPTDYNGYNLELKPGSAEELARLIAPMVHEIPDYRHTLPSLDVQTVEIPLPPDTLKVYRQMAGSMAAEGVVADTAAIKVMKLQQIANGFLYDDDHVIDLDTTKIDWVKNLPKKAGKSFVAPILLVYQFQEELDRIKANLPGLVVLGEAGDVSQVIEDWQQGRIDYLAMHPKSGGHGLDGLQHGGHTVIWLSPPWSRDLFDQTNARVWRRGQVDAVSVAVLLGVDTVDELIWARLGDKAELMPAFMAHIKKAAI